MMVEAAATVVAPRFSRGRAAWTVVAALTIAGALIGVLWSWLAPPVHAVVVLTRTGDRVLAYIGNDADNFFFAAFLNVGLVVVLAVIAAVLVWQWRAHRGPVLAAALAVGCAIAAAAAAAVGAVLVRWRYGRIDITSAPVSPEDRVHDVIEAPAVFFGHSPLLIAATVLFPAAVAALVYALIAVSTGRDDLGGWPPQEPTGRTGTADDARPADPPPPLP